MKKDFFIQLGAVADSIQKQFKAQGVPLDQEEAWKYEKIRQAILTLAIPGYLSTAEAERARRRLIAEISRKIVAAQKGKTP